MVTATTFFLGAAGTAVRTEGFQNGFECVLCGPVYVSRSENTGRKRGGDRET
jgi:hypothetical protein